MSDKVGFSFVIDGDPATAYQGWHLAHSIIDCLGVEPGNIFVQYMEDADRRIVRKFESIGCVTNQMERFCDRRECNKLAQWNDILRNSGVDHFVFLDTDTIFVDNCLDRLRRDSISAKVVDQANPPISVIEEIMRAAGFKSLPAERQVDSGRDMTYLGNSDGGMLSIPRIFADSLFAAWRKWALWLLNNLEPLQRAGKEFPVDQVSFCMAIHETDLPFQFVASNLNYFMHFAGPHNYYADEPISLLHYRGVSMNVLGGLDPPGAVTPAEKEAARLANVQIARHFDNTIFWDMRYAHFPERGSGVGSRGENLEYKRKLLRKCGVEQAGSVLDVGCGDLEVVKELGIRRYFGVDQSTTTLEIARRVRPDWTFSQAPCPQAPASELVLCFEVLIHQESASGYHNLIAYLAEKTDGVLLVSGYEESSELIEKNPMLFFYEPLSLSLKRTGKFKSVEVAGRFTEITIFRCVVGSPGLGERFRRWLRRGSAERAAPAAAEAISRAGRSARFAVQ